MTGFQAVGYLLYDPVLDGNVFLLSVQGRGRRYNLYVLE
jgi:hypothetical protein